jgi:hypothetical protein
MEIDPATESGETIELRPDIQDVRLIHTWKFILLSLATLGLYPIWWHYKGWRFFNQKDRMGINSALRTIFALFFIYALFREIKAYAKENNVSVAYPSILLLLGIFFFSLLGQMPFPLALLSLLGITFWILPFRALNLSKQNSKQFSARYIKGFSAGQIVLLIIGFILWSGVILDMMLTL